MQKIERYIEKRKKERKGRTGEDRGVGEERGAGKEENTKKEERKKKEKEKMVLKRELEHEQCQECLEEDIRELKKRFSMEK